MPTILELARDIFLDRLQALSAIAHEDTHDLALVLVDLHNLRQINHQHAFSLGDALLEEMGKQLANMANREATVFRIASHTFAVILPKVKQLALIPAIIGRMRDTLEDAMELDAQLIPAKLLFAVALNRAGSHSALLTLASAEEHLASLRAGNIQDLDIVLGAAAKTEDPLKQLVQPFSTALRDSKLMLFYQPQVDSTSGEVTGAEALLRWIDKQHGFISPETAVQLAEANNKIFDLTKWVAHTAARQHRDWSNAGLVIPLSINLPPSILTRPDLGVMLDGAARIWDMHPGQMTLEITEQGLMHDPQAGTRAMERLRELGFNISIDDFGTGYSSLSYFHDVPATELKVDRSFVGRLAHSVQDQGIVRTVSELARIFDMRVVAEGVEDAATFNALGALGCDILQGFGISRPIPPDDFAAWHPTWDKLVSLRRDAAHVHQHARATAEETR